MKNVRRLLVVILLISIVCTTEAAGAEEQKFTDIDTGHWAYLKIKELLQTGVVSGFPDGSYRPEDLVTYGEFIKMTVLIVNGESPLYEGAASGHWALRYYEAGLNMGYYTVHDINERALDQPIPRGYMALIISSAMNGITPQEYDYQPILESISDIDSRTPYEFEIVNAYGAGILEGYPDGTFRPADFLTRAEAAVAVNKLMKKCTEEDMHKSPDHTESLVIEGSVLSSEPEGTVTLTIHDFGYNIDEQKRELKAKLEQHFPTQEENIFLSVLDFAGKNAGPGGQGIRKQYFDEIPVLMERLDSTVRIFLFPAGYTSRTWNTLPGQIKEEFF